jgi:hypothetical protein
MGSAAIKKVSPNELSFVSWYEAPLWARRLLRAWVWGMEPARDGEMGPGTDGAGAWLDEKVTLSGPGRLFQTFLAIHAEQVVWTGSVVEDDRGVRGQLAEMGHPVDAVFGLFNTRYDLRGRGIGWTGANYVNKYVLERGGPSIALFTRNPAAERHYKALSFECIGDIEIPAFGAIERLYIRQEAKPS